MEDLLREIIEALRTADSLDETELDRIVRKHNRGLPAGTPHYAKRQIVPFYLKIKREQPERWQSWNIDDALEGRLMRAVRMKPGRTASGVATITVLTKPWKCGGTCLYCPNDLTMPKSYLQDEPACQRAERNFFDPYLQVKGRLHALEQMGHVTDKIELIVLGGTWNDYPQSYRIWFASELFRALADNDAPGDTSAGRRKRYEAAGIACTKEACKQAAAEWQAQVNAGILTYNDAWRHLYGTNTAWQEVAEWQTTQIDELRRWQKRNECAHHRMVGLVMETRPETVSVENLTLLRQLGATKVQIGVQSLDAHVLECNGRTIDPDAIAYSFSLARLFGFKIHSHFMVNLLGSTPEQDRTDYHRLVEGPKWQPDEVKLYPCVLVAGTGLHGRFIDGSWRPYDERTLVDVLAADVAATPPYVRISRMIRDISSHDIEAGNKKINLRQSVDAKLAAEGCNVEEMRSREIRSSDAAVDELRMDCVAYKTEFTDERFLQWVAPDNRLAGFLRLSLPRPSAFERWGRQLPVSPGQAMIREVHVYGRVAGLGSEGSGAQHHGLGSQLIDAACDIARSQGYDAINVISAVGTREYYRHLGFEDQGLYQLKHLEPMRQDEETEGRR